MFQNGQKIFSDKISDLNKNSLNVGTFQHIPSVIEKDEYSNGYTTDKNILRFGGVEIEVIHNFYFILFNSNVLKMLILHESMNIDGIFLYTDFKLSIKSTKFST